ncbi:MAG: hypothetical protein D6732_22375 [Methanobacteriota archaeon]|nr:MAG: hypothetical protein D6732_22375 [Euryarchaeota archaeon]
MDISNFILLKDFKLNIFRVRQLSILFLLPPLLPALDAVGAVKRSKRCSCTVPKWHLLQDFAPECYYSDAERPHFPSAAGAAEGENG